MFNKLVLISNSRYEPVAETQQGGAFGRTGQGTEATGNCRHPLHLGQDHQEHALDLAAQTERMPRREAGLKLF